MARIALSGVIGALSYALDIAEGEPPGHAVRSCLIGMRLAAELDLSASDRSDLFYALLLKDAGCSANANRMAALFAADDRAAKATSKLVDWTDNASAFMWSLRTIAPGAGLRRRIEVLRGIRDEGDVTRKFMEARCDRGAEIARMLFLSEQTAAAIRSLDEHWDGRGLPDGLRGEEIPLPRGSCASPRRSRCFMPPAVFAAARRSLGAVAGAGSIRRSSTPSCASATTATSGPRCQAPTSPAWEPPDLALWATTTASTASPRHSPRVIDAKSPFTARHSERVAEIADGIAAVLGFDARAAADPAPGGAAARHRQARDLQPHPRQAGQLTDEEFSAIREHPLHTLRILERAPCFADARRPCRRPPREARRQRLPARAAAQTISTCRCVCSRSPTSMRR